MSGLSEIGVPKPNVVFVVRRFYAKCPACGQFIHDRAGHHDTFVETEMNQLFPKGQRKQLRNALSPEDRKIFNQTLRGKREPHDGEVARWLALQKSIEL